MLDQTLSADNYEPPNRDLKVGDFVRINQSLECAVEREYVSDGVPIGQLIKGHLGVFDQKNGIIINIEYKLSDHRYRVALLKWVETRTSIHIGGDYADVELELLSHRLLTKEERTCVLSACMYMGVDPMVVAQALIGNIST